ncbi:MAG: cytochrome C [Burkholderiaceae bacterium]|nr:cytochrome C [Burkholderiaceae bacterium]
MAALAAVGCGGAAAQPASLRSAMMAASCNACHGPDGASIAGIPPLNGRPAEELAKIMLDFKYDRRSGTVMNRHMRGYSDEELRAIAAEFARAKAPSSK